MKLAIALLALATSAFAQTQTASPALPTTASGKPLAFTIVSVRPHGNAPTGPQGCNIDACHFVDVTLRLLVDSAYSISNKLVFGGPPFASEDHFDIDAKIDPGDMPASPPSRPQLIQMLQPVLADRFQLHVHHETRSFPAYDLVLAKAGPKLTTTAAEPTSPCGVSSKGDGSAAARNCAMDSIAHLLWSPTGRYVIDKTGLTGRYDVDLHWTPDNASADSPIAGGPSIFTAVQEQLGLKLEPSTIPLDALVIDSAEKPSAN